MITSCRGSEHTTKPPARFNEATLVRALEELGIGRPSTFASILQIIKSRGYVIGSGGAGANGASGGVISSNASSSGALIPCPAGRLLSAFLEMKYPLVVDFDFTALMEERLDSVASGTAAWQDTVRDLWIPLEATTKQVEDLDRVLLQREIDHHLELLLGYPFTLVENNPHPDASSSSSSSSSSPPEEEEEGEEKGEEEEEEGEEGPRSRGPRHTGGRVPRVPGMVVSRSCPKCGRGELKLCIHRSGAWIGCSQYPDCDNQLPVFPSFSGVTGAREGGSDDDGDTGGEGGGRPEVVDTAATTPTISYPRELGKHPEDGSDVVVKIGPFGAYVDWTGGKLKASLASRRSPDPAVITLEEAIQVLQWKKERVAAKAAAEKDTLPAEDPKRPQEKRKRPVDKKGKRSGTNAYILFSQAKRAEVKAAHPDWPATEVVRELGRLWRDVASDEDRKQYQALAAAAAGAEKNGSESRTSSPSRERSKRGGNGWLLFLNERRPAVRDAHPEFTLGEVTKYVSKSWKEMTPDEKEDYQRRAKEKV